MEGICTCLPTFVFKILVLVKAFFLFKFWLQKYSKIAFSALGKILVLVNCFFLFKFKLQKFSKIDFLCFWQVLVLANAFFYSISNLKKVLTNDFLLLARSWLWRMLFSIQFLILI